MSVERIVVDDLGRLPQFSHAGVAAGLVFVSGTLGTTGGFDLADGVGAQTTQTLENLGRILETAGSSWDEVVKVDVFLADLDDFAAMNEAYSDFFGATTPPARITTGGAALALGARVEMDCVARDPAATRGAPTTSLPRRATGDVDHDGERLHFEDCGDPDDPVVVLCHGAGGNHAVWFQQVHELCRRGKRVITWDHRGYGRSTDRANRSGPEVAAGDLLAVLDHLGVDRADLVGQSMGGWTVIGVALLRPALVRRLVLADTLGGFVSESITEALARPRRGAAAPLDAAELGRHPALDEEFTRRRPEMAHLYQSLGTMGSADPVTLIERLMATTHDADEAARIDCPVLCVVGDRDPLFPPGAVRAVADLFDDARFAEIPGAGHSPYFEAPEVWNALVGRFLDG